MAQKAVALLLPTLATVPNSKPPAQHQLLRNFLGQKARRSAEGDARSRIPVPPDLWIHAHRWDAEHFTEFLSLVQILAGFFTPYSSKLPTAKPLC